MKLAISGDTLNTAIYLAREAKDQDVRVDYVTVLGEDIASEGALDLMQSEGLSTEFIHRVQDRNIGIYAIENDAYGERRFHYWRNSSAARTLFCDANSLELDAILSADLVYLSGITLSIMSEDARQRLFSALSSKRLNGCLVAFDSNYRLSLWEDHSTACKWIEVFWQITDIGLPTIEDEMELFGDQNSQAIIARLNRLGIKKGALKQGALGPCALSGVDYETLYPSAETVLDTTGAGDSFNGAYLAAFVSGETEQSCLARAHNIARQVVGCRGAILPQTPNVNPKRVGSAIRLRPEHSSRYIELHSNVWPDVLKRLKEANVSQFSIFLKEPEHLMFSYFEYSGNDYEVDMATTLRQIKICFDEMRFCLSHCKSEYEILGSF